MQKFIQGSNPITDNAQSKPNNIKATIKMVKESAVKG